MFLNFDFDSDNNNNIDMSMLENEIISKDNELLKNLVSISNNNNGNVKELAHA